MICATLSTVFFSARALCRQRTTTMTMMTLMMTRQLMTVPTIMPTCCRLHTWPSHYHNHHLVTTLKTCCKYTHTVLFFQSHEIPKLFHDLCLMTVGYSRRLARFEKILIVDSDSNLRRIYLHVQAKSVPTRLRRLRACLNVRLDEVRCAGAHPQALAFKLARVNPIKLAYDTCQPDGRPHSDQRL